MLWRGRSQCWERGCRALSCNGDCGAEQERSRGLGLQGSAWLSRMFAGEGWGGGGSFQRFVCEAGALQAREGATGKESKSTGGGQLARRRGRGCRGGEAESRRGWTDWLDVCYYHITMQSLGQAGAAVQKDS